MRTGTRTVRTGTRTVRTGTRTVRTGTRTVRTGTRWRLGPDVVVALEATRQTNGTGDADNEVRLRAAVRF